MIVKKIIILKFIIISIILSGCVTHVNNSNNFIINPQQAAKINKLNTWSLYGKMRWKDQQNKQAAMCYIKWMKNYNKSYITLNSFMNLKSINLEIENDKIKIIDNSNILPRDIENIINNISLNIDNLNYWLLGSPNPKYEYALIKQGFHQQGWEIKYNGNKRYSNIYMPKIIIMKHKHLQIFIKLILY